MDAGEDMTPRRMRNAIPLLALVALLSLAGLGGAQGPRSALSAIQTATPFIFIPATVTPPGMAWMPLAAPASRQPGLWLEPAILFGGAWYIEPGMLTVRAAVAPGAARVTFHMAQAGQPPTILGVDADLSDGASVAWLAFGAVRARLWAEIAWPDGRTLSTGPILVRRGPPPARLIGAIRHRD
jgi:hypothetical protein